MNAADLQLHLTTIQASVDAIRKLIDEPQKSETSPPEPEVFEARFWYEGGKAHWQVVKQPEKWRGPPDAFRNIFSPDNFHIKSVSWPAIYSGDDGMAVLYLQGTSRAGDSYIATQYMKLARYADMLAFLGRFQEWCESQNVACVIHTTKGE